VRFFALYTQHARQHGFYEGSTVGERSHTRAGLSETGDASAADIEVDSARNHSLDRVVISEASAHDAAVGMCERAVTDDELSGIVVTTGGNLGWVSPSAVIGQHQADSVSAALEANNDGFGGGSQAGVQDAGKDDSDLVRVSVALPRLRAVSDTSSPSRSQNSAHTLPLPVTLHAAVNTAPAPVLAGAVSHSPSRSAAASFYSLLDSLLIRARMHTVRSQAMFMALLCIPRLVYFVWRLGVTEPYRTWSSVGCRLDYADMYSFMSITIPFFVMTLPLLLRLRSQHDTLLIRYELAAQLFAFPPLRCVVLRWKIHRCRHHSGERRLRVSRCDVGY
jgi:hypothetical protein